MARVSDLDLGREEDNVELSLGLSIGGSGFRKRPVWSPSEIGGIEEKDVKTVAGSTVDPALILEAKGSNGADFLDPKSKREMHALRRQEARKKMEEKQMKKNNGNGNGNGVFVNKVVAVRNVSSVEDRSALEAQGMQCRVRDRAMKEAELCRMQRNCRKNGEICGSENREQNPNPNPHPNPNSGVTSFQVVPVSVPVQTQYPFHPVQFMPFANGHRYPYVMPCWAAATSSAGQPAGAVAIGGDELKHPVTCRSFRPFQMPNRDPHQSVKQIPGCESDQNDGSMGSSSSGVSDNQSASLQGGSSAETRSHSSHSPLEQTQTHVSPIHRAQGLVEHKASSHQIKPSQGAEITTDKAVSIDAQISPRKQEEAIPVNEPNSDTKSPPPKSPLTPSNRWVDKKEDKKQNPLSLSSLPRMPCVSTTGPNGKTITGFLYRYTKTEVSIICVCHGSSFSPEEFVKHAGGTDVSHPLRHIVVAPSTIE